MEVVGRELINDVGRGRSGWPGVSFHGGEGRHDFWREFEMGLRGSKFVGIQFTVQKPSPSRETTFQSGKNGKNKFIFMKMFPDIRFSPRVSRQPPREQAQIEAGEGVKSTRQV